MTMAVEHGLRALLLTMPTIMQFVPPQTVAGIEYARVFNEVIPQGITLPFILISLTDRSPFLRFDGTTGLRATTFDVDCYASSHPAAVAIANAVSAQLMDFTGAAGDSDVIRAVEWEGSRYDAVAESEGRDVWQHIVSQSFQIYHE